MAGMRILGTIAILIFTSAAAAAEPVEVTGHIFRPQQVEPSDERVAALKVPAGFHVTKFAEKLGHARILAVSDSGVIYVSRRQEGDVLALRDANGDGKTDDVRTVWRLPDAHGLAVHDGKLFVVTINELFAAPIVDPAGNLGEPKKLYDHLPDAGQHPNRTIAFGPDGMLYISVGSTANGAWESNKENATLLQAKPDGAGRSIFARGLRNTIGFAWHPKTGAMWGMDHGYDWMGDDKPPEELNELKKDADYGWPFLWENNQPNPERDPKQYEVGTYEDWQKKCTPSVLTYAAHAAPMQMAFYSGGPFPQEYHNDAFVAFHGSWNRKTPKGYEVARVHFDASGRPEKFEPFLTGFLGGDGATISGRPVGLVVAKDGALLVSDDLNGVVYRVSYGK